jgi:tRNA(Arg) A34 adenosine deaminase TadA
MNDSDVMGLALAEAGIALSEREVPVGCVFALPAAEAGAGPGYWREPFARAHNRTNATYSPQQHAEMVALHALVDDFGGGAGGDALAGLRGVLAQATLFVTVEPCIMCADALAKAGVLSVVYGCPNDKFGGCGTVADVFGGGTTAGRTVRSGLRAEEAVGLLKQFYARANERAPLGAAAKEARTEEGAQ